jgi:hypothetical protein
LISQSSDERSHEHEHDGDAREPPLEPHLLDDLSVLFDVGSASVRYLEEMPAVDRVGENVVGERGEIRVVWVLRVRLEKSVSIVVGERRKVKLLMKPPPSKTITPPGKTWRE